MKHLLASAAALLLTAISIQAQSPRVVRSINDRWTFVKEGKTETVSFPHTWNAHDTWDETPGFYRGACTYTRDIVINDDLDGRNVTLRFEGAGQDMDVTVNGHYVGNHKGGYTAFSFDITPYVHNGANKFEFKLDNSHNPSIPPLSADFTFYGGVYRDVDLVITPSTHISTTHYASSGVFITTPSVSKESSDVVIRTLLTNSDGLKRTVLLQQDVFGPDGVRVHSVSDKVKLAKGCKEMWATASFSIRDCRIWDVDDPELYEVVTTLKTDKGEVLDMVTNPLGFRTFNFDPDHGFTLNGRHLKIMGTNRHQDYEDRGNALSDEMHVRDLRLLKEMGGNFLRIAHYPQDPIVTQSCDHEGIVCSVEIPIVNYITMSDEFRHNCVEMAREMVCQDFNSPSVLIWAYMNEVLLRGPANGKDEAALKEYYDYTTSIAKDIDAAIKEIDPYRPTMIPCHSDYRRYKKSGLGEVPDILGWNYYRGWYGKGFEDFPKEIQEVHATFPDKPFILTEYGAGVDPRLHSRKPERFDFSAEYGLMFHKYYIDVIRSTEFISGSNVWNLNDFYAENRVDAVPHVNNKGLVGLDRVPKDSYRLYQAVLLKEPVLYIGSRDWNLRSGNEGETSIFEVYTNASEVTLYHNGRTVGTASPVKGAVSFEVVLTDGDNVISAEAPGGLKDAVHVHYTAVPKDMGAFKEMNVMLGSNRYFQDDIAGAAWMPEQEYRPGSWGYVGGDVFRPSGLPCSTLDILGTINNPIFQSQRVGLEAFKADVPDGKYFVYLYLSELAVSDTGEPLPYNLGQDMKGIKETKREFDVDINGTPVIKGLNLREEFGSRTAVIRKFTVDVRGGEGLTVGFTAVEGSPVLNAIRIYRCI